MIDPPADIPPPPTRRRDELFVAAGLAAVAAWVLFSTLDGHRMEPDESLYALATDHLRAGGDWLTLSPHPPTPYFNKPPMYMWLSALTYDRLPGFELKYRFWSAAFGVAAVALTGAVGARLFRPAVGLVAGLLLLTNRSFLLHHGARFGGMDAALTACTAATLWLYWVGRTRAGGAWPWACIGVVAGSASLFKPLAGLPMLAVIGLHAVVTRRAVLHGAGGRPPSLLPLQKPSAEPDGSGGRPPIAVGSAATVGPAVAAGIVLVVSAAVAGPWYWINHQRFPDRFAGQLFGRQLADSMAGGSPDDASQPWFFHLAGVPASSTLWALVVPAAAWLVVAAVRDRRRRPALLLLLIAGLGWVVGFSVPQKKFLHYVYPAFPALAVTMAAGLADLLAFAGRRGRRVGIPAGLWRRIDPERFVAGGLRATAAGLVAFAGYLGLVALPREASPLPAWTLYKTFEPAIRDGRADLLAWGVPHRPDAWPDERLVRPNHMIYLSHMAGVQTVRDAADVTARLATGRPTVLILSRDQDLSALPVLHPSGHRVDERFTVEERPYSALVIDVDPLLAPTLRPDRPSSYLRFVGQSPAAVMPAATVPSETASPAVAPFRFSGGEFAIEVTAPLPEHVRLALLIRAADGQPRRRVRCVFTGSNREPVDLQPMDFVGTHRVAVELGADDGRSAARRVVRVRLVPVDGGDAAVAGEVVEAVLRVVPR